MRKERNGGTIADGEGVGEGVGEAGEAGAGPNVKEEESMNKVFKCWFHGLGY